MRKLLLSLLTISFFVSCSKQISTDKSSEEITATSGKQLKTTVCHYDANTGTSKTISVSPNALAGHLAHGDFQGNCSIIFTTICEQVWMTKNLDVSTYRNGDPIPQVTDPSLWAGLTTGAWSYYENNTANGTTYGKLYNWYAINDPRGLAPEGWHVPSDAEWTALMNCLGGESVAGGKMKETGTAHWLSPNTGADNSSGFTALPGGVRDNAGAFLDLAFRGYWWSATEYTTSIAGAWFLGYNTASLGRVNANKTDGISVRLVRD
jgi:uncharacterized protein (TIGR02145 family)